MLYILTLVYLYLSYTIALLVLRKNNAVRVFIVKIESYTNQISLLPDGFFIILEQQTTTSFGNVYHP